MRGLPIRSQSGRSPSFSTIQSTVLKKGCIRGPHGRDCVACEAMNALVNRRCSASLRSSWRTTSREAKSTMSATGSPCSRTRRSSASPKQVEAGGGTPACRCEADAAQDAFAGGRGLRIGGRHPEAVREIIGDRVSVAGAPQLAVEHRHERRRRYRARCVLQEVVVPDIAREDELALERQEPPEIP